MDRTRRTASCASRTGLLHARGAAAACVMLLLLARGGARAGEVPPRWKTMSTAERAAHVEVLGRDLAAARGARRLLIGALKAGAKPVQRASVEVLARLGPAAVPWLIDALDHDVMIADPNAVEALVRIGAPARRALVKRLRHARAEHRSRAAFALGKMGQAAARAVPALTKLLSDRSSAPRRAAIIALGNIGPPASRAVPQLVKRLESEHKALLRTNAATSIGKIGHSTAAAVKALVRALEDGNRHVVAGACSALGRLRARAAVPALILALSHPCRTVRFSAIEALGRLGPMARAALPALRALVGKKSDPAANRACPSRLFSTHHVDQQLLKRALRNIAVQGSLDKEVVRRVIRAHLNQVKYCYQKGLLRQPKLQGTVRIQFTIAPDGTVAASRVMRSDLDDPAVGTCIASAVRSWRFPRPKGGGVVVINYPFRLRPTQ